MEDLGDSEPQGPRDTPTPSDIFPDDTTEWGDIIDRFFSKDKDNRDKKESLSTLLNEIVDRKVGEIRKTVDMHEKKMKGYKNGFTLWGGSTAGITPPPNLTTKTDFSVHKAANIARLFSTVPTFENKDGYEVRRFLLAINALANKGSFPISEAELKTIVLSKLHPKVQIVLNIGDEEMSLSDIYAKLLYIFDMSEQPAQASLNLALLKPSAMIKSVDSFLAEALRLMELCGEKSESSKSFCSGLLNFLPERLKFILQDKLIDYQSVEGITAYPPLAHLISFLKPHRNEINDHLSKTSVRAVEASFKTHEKKPSNDRNTLGQDAQYSPQNVFRYQ